VTPDRTATAEAEAVERQPRLRILDGLRLVAALMVVAWHFVAGEAGTAWQTGTKELFAPLWKLSGYGWLGVELFFLISGFVICMSSWGRTAGQFAVSRIARLFPAYWAAIVITTVVVTLWPVMKQPLSTVDVLVNLTMLQGLLGVPHVDWSYWSLAVELQFYLLFAIVIARGVTYARVVGFCLAWTLVSIVVTGFGNNHLSAVFAANYTPLFVAGIAFYLIHRFGSTVLLWGIVAVSWVLSLVRVKGELWWNGAGIRPTAIIITGFFVLMAVIAMRRLDRVDWRWLTTAGALTFPLYLLHQYVGLTVIRLVHPHLPPWVLLIGLVLALLLVSWLMHRLVERPVARLLRRHLTGSLERLRAPHPPRRRPIVPAQPATPAASPQEAASPQAAVSPQAAASRYPDAPAESAASPHPGTPAEPAVSPDPVAPVTR
jgi:peptidoglycan/LPS O-acetylase OafA/YrhL